METIKIAIDVNVNLSEATQAFVKNLFSGHCTCNSAPTVQTPAKPAAEPEPVKPQATVQEAPTVQPAAPAHSEPAATPVLGPSAAQAVTSATVSIEQVRKALAEKINDYRSVIKQKLNELGAPSVTKLDPAKYNEMYEFLNAL